jgi:hypothetical protein
MLHLEPTPEPEPRQSRANGGDPALGLLAVQLPLAAWQRIVTQLGEGSVNQYLGLITMIQQQLQGQLQPPRQEEAQ